MSHAKRDELMRLQHVAQKQWESAKVFELDAAPGTEKYLATFPYPYMNGRLHLGHTFTLARVEFTTGYERLKGKRAIFPFGLHCTGMPIKACADRLAREIAKFGCPPQFPEEAEEAAAPAPVAAAPTSAETQKFAGKKTKAVAKAGSGKFQWNIMEAMGVPTEEIHKFADANYWLSYFPPRALEDLKLMGCKVDYRRSFITTDVNPYYDRFVQWQFLKLRAHDKLVLGQRDCIWSPLDGQQCGDHDRASGEGVKPLEYTAIKMRVVKFTEAIKSLEGRKVFFVAATMRPETMYGQTNFFVLPEGKYGAYESIDDEIFIICNHAARNMAFQGFSKVPRETSCLFEVTGADLIGAGVKSPLTHHEVIYCLPMMSILMDKGTGVVTSVPSDAPADYVALSELKRKPAFRQKFNVADETVMPFEVIDIIEVPDLGTHYAVDICVAMKIETMGEKEKLAKAKDEVYLKGFNTGRLIVGPYAGRLVKDVKPIIKKELIEAGLAFRFSEPEKEVRSRSGDVCVVCRAEQWNLKYGEPEWRELTKKCLSKVETYNVDVKHQFEATLDWLEEWACCREFGLGTRLPWDKRWLIESLSDSTIYMAYYAIVQLLQQPGDLEGKQIGPSGIKAEQLTEAVFDYIFLEAAYPSDCGIPESMLQKLRAEFEYWYPVDLRVSGKDLIQNHLTMFMYNHTAIFPEKYWPKSIRCNGHVLLNNEKMSKSTGNFLTLSEGVEKYSADAMRFALAMAGDGVEDANFADEVANSAILKLYTFYELARDLADGKEKTRTGPADHFWDNVLMSVINKVITETDKHYAAMNMRDAMMSGFFELQEQLNRYRMGTRTILMHADVMKRFITVQCLLLSPITPHTAEGVWNILGNQDSIMNARWPEAGPVNEVLLAEANYLIETSRAMRKALDFTGQPKAAKKGAPAVPQVRCNTAYVYVAKRYLGWQGIVMERLAAIFAREGGKWPDTKELVPELKAVPELSDGATWKKVMPFVQAVQQNVQTRGVAALAVESPFDELALLRSQQAFMAEALTIPFENVCAFDAEDEAAPDPLKGRKSSALPASPAYCFVTQ
eukprot:TRINITY_DN15067_c0_g1_i1.p1 TRINITY_DN15067_c0_g1~~TRINITY_DN15067_c0_g1_i1.p1  ORF type:complete len:1078 (+),score=262.34 TRINITY_DN15067_c0_g1_i1:34-3234(+)